MQMAAYIGLKLRGVQGAIFAFVGFGLPAFLLMSVLSMAYSRTYSLPAVTSIFNGLQAVIVAVMANATLAFGRTSLSHWKDAIIALVAAGLFGFMANPVFIVALSALLGILLTSWPNAAKNAIHADQIKPTTLSLLILLVVFGAGFVLLLMLRKELFELAILMSKVDLLAFERTRAHHKKTQCFCTGFFSGESGRVLQALLRRIRSRSATWRRRTTGCPDFGRSRRPCSRSSRLPGRGRRPEPG
jgi:chromate transport protein ChrA